MKECPCKKCISFAICKQKALELNDVSDLSRIRQCNDLIEYLTINNLDSWKEDWDCNIGSSRINKTRRLFGLRIIG